LCRKERKIVLRGTEDEKSKGNYRGCCADDRGIHFGADPTEDKKSEESWREKLFVEIHARLKAIRDEGDSQGHSTQTKLSNEREKPIKKPPRRE